MMIAGLTRRSLVATLAAVTGRRSSAQQCKVIDSAVHVWSDGQPPYPWAVEPPKELYKAATYDALESSARAAGVSGALIVQPANHKFDHSYVSAALKAHPDFYRGMCLADPTLEPAAAASELERLHGEGFVGVRFNPYLFPEGLDSPVGHALYKKAGELKMPVGVMCFKGFLPQLPALTALLDASPATTLVIDHLGFFRQPATGGLQGADATNDEAAWEALLALAVRPQVHVKVSALFRTSAELPPHADLQPRLAALCAARTFSPDPQLRAQPGDSRPSAPGAGSPPTAHRGSCGAPTSPLCCWEARRPMRTPSTTHKPPACSTRGSRCPASTRRRRSSSWAGRRRSCLASRRRTGSLYVSTYCTTRERTLAWAISIIHRLLNGHRRPAPESAPRAASRDTRATLESRL